MEEIVLIDSEHYDAKKFFRITIIVGFVLSAVLFCAFCVDMDNRFGHQYNTHLRHQQQGSCCDAGSLNNPEEICDVCRAVGKHRTKIGCLAHLALSHYSLGLCFAPLITFALLGGLIRLWICSCKLTVTDKRIYGKIAWGKKVSVPIHAITSIATTRLSKGISILTFFGKISFFAIKNADEIYAVINILVSETQARKFT